MEGKVSPKTLENGKVLCYLKLRFLEDIGDEQAMAALLSCLRDSNVWVPCQVRMEAEDLEQFQAAKAGEIITTQEETRLVPDILRAKDGALYFPMFSQREQIPEE
ncbi:SseB family protein, partial [uncultured Intestinimonas sp.]